MKYNILLIVLIAFSSAQEDSPGASAPMQLEDQEQDNQGLSEENSGIFSGGEFKRGMGPMDQFFLKDLFETITAAFDNLAEDPNDSTFLQDNKQLNQQDNIDENVIQYGSPTLGIFDPLFQMFQTQGDSNFVEIETISINGQTQTKVTKTSTRNGITTITTEITTETSNQGLDQDQQNTLSDDFQLFENPTTNEFLNEKDQLQNDIDIIQQDENLQINQINLDSINSMQELHTIQDNYVKNDQQVNVLPKYDNNLTLGITILCGLSLAAAIGFSIKKCAFKKE